MKIYKDIVNALKIENVYVISNKVLFMCVPLEIKKNFWLISCDSAGLSGEVILKVKFNGSFIYLKSKISIKEQDTFNSFTYELEIDTEEQEKDRFKYMFFTMIYKLEEEYEKWNKRSEERYEIGLDENRIKAIGFKSAEQTVVFEKQQLPCLINNISYKGAKITTIEANFQKDKKLCLFLSFTAPMEQIPLIANIRNCLIKTTKDNTPICILSVEYETVSYSYKTRIDNYIKTIDEIKKGATCL